MTGVYGTRKVMRSLAEENPMTRKSRFALLTTGERMNPPTALLFSMCKHHGESLTRDPISIPKNLRSYLQKMQTRSARADGVVPIYAQDGRKKSYVAYKARKCYS